tara:strand:+ start:121 stop:1554 length:1434 start_codon:yes stop_codon:yes gene_type:complete
LGSQNSYKQYLFYDLETSGTNPSFDQILQFAGVKTDLSFNEIERYEFRIKLRNDVIPEPGALIVNRLNIDKIIVGESEYDAVKKIQSILSAPGTINIGYNSISFDDEFMRFNYFRNLLEPYANQKSGCIRMDLLPITLMYYLFKKESMIWPVNNGKVNLKLENLNDLNGLADGMAHDAVVDVLATIEMARRFKEFDPNMWDYLCGHFNKKQDYERIGKLEEVVFSDDFKCRKGFFIKNGFGYQNNCISACIVIGKHQTRDQTYWLRLDKEDFTRYSNNNEIQNVLKKNIVKRKTAVPDFILPFKERYFELLTKDKRNTLDLNLNWLFDNYSELLILKEDLIAFEYEDKKVDLDSSLYQRDFFTNKEKKVFNHFHSLDEPSDKIAFAESLNPSFEREMSIRILGRNFYELLPEKIKIEYDALVLKIAEDDFTDHMGRRRNTVEKALNNIRKIMSDPSKYDNEQYDILKSYESYLLNRS